MKYFDSKGRPVDIEKTAGGYEEAYVEAASYLDVDSGLPRAEYNKLCEVPEEELEYLTQAYAEEIADREYQNAVAYAECAFEGDR